METTHESHEPISPKENIRQGRVQKLTDLADKGINAYPYSVNCHYFLMKRPLGHSKKAFLKCQNT